MQPISAGPGRIEVIDILRGFTLLGIALVHFTEQYYAGQFPEVHLATQTIPDQIISQLIGIFISGKFFMIFSFLFGMSFFIQLSNNDGSPGFILRFSWRLVILFIIGFIHHLHYRGDILGIYAVLGFGLLLAYRLPDRVLLVIAMMLIFDLPGIVSRLVDVITTSAPPSFFNADQHELEQYFNTVKTGSYAEILKTNLYEFKSKLDFQVFSGRLYTTMGLFLFGLYAGRKKIFSDVSYFKRNMRLSLWLLIGSIVFALLFFGGTYFLGITINQQGQWLVGGSVMEVFNAALAFIYVGIIVRLFEKDKWKKRLKVFYSAGRMGLTTYLMQTMVGIFIYFSIGMALIGEIGSAAAAGIAILVFIGQIIFSNFWLSNFRYGPVEWLWRSLTQLKIQPIKKDKEFASTVA